jgi:hypothetical protein
MTQTLVALLNYIRSVFSKRAEQKQRRRVNTGFLLRGEQLEPGATTVMDVLHPLNHILRVK